MWNGWLNYLIDSYDVDNILISMWNININININIILIN